MSRTVTDPQPILFFCWLITGIISFLGSMIWLILQPDLLVRPEMDPLVISWTHLIVLGWLSSIFFAAGYQLTPVVTLNPLFSKTLSRIHFVAHVIGFALMVYAFSSMHYHLLAIGGSLVFFGFLLFVLNSVLTAGWQSKWGTLSFIWFAGLFWLVVGGCMALFAVYLKLHPMEEFNFQNIVGIHIHTMLIGFFLMMLIAASSKLIPMFLLSPERPQTGSLISSVLIMISLFIVYFTHGSIPLINQVLCYLIGFALCAYFVQVVYFVIKRKRKIDAGFALFLTGVLLLLPGWFSFMSFHNGLQHFDFVPLKEGVFTLVILVFNGCILGMAQKIVPFMMWHHLYSKHLGRAQVPQTSELLNSWTLWPVWGCFCVSCMFFLGSFFFNQNQFIITGAVSMVVAYVFFTLNAPKFIFHWKNPQLKPFQPIKSE